MSTLSARIDKLAARIPASTLPVKEAKSLDFSEFIAKTKAEELRVAALSPVDKIFHVREKIAGVVAEALEPPPVQGDDHAGAFCIRIACHKFAKNDVRDGFHKEHFEIRRCEIEILRQHNQDVSRLDAAHQRFAKIPWQWVPEDNQLPPDAQEIIDQALKQEAVP
jgi:hypothetical protein